jgi:hypothetical protein
MYSVYWIKNTNHRNPNEEGYISISKEPIKRFNEYRNSRANNIQNTLNVQIIAENLTLTQALELEKSYRPNKRKRPNEP